MPTQNSSDYSPVQNAIQIGGANGKLASLPMGTTGLVLTSNGAGSSPTFQVSEPPVGTMSYISDGGSAPGGKWLKCDGSVYLQSTYPTLYSKIGLLNLQITPVIYDFFPANNLMYSATYGGVAPFVFVGKNATTGVSVTSSDGQVLNTPNAIPGSTAIYSIVNYGTGYVCAGENAGNAFLANSTNGISWITKASSAYAPIYLLATNGTYYFLQDQLGNSAYTTDPTGTWNSVSVGNTFNSIYGNPTTGVFLAWVAVSGGYGIYKSTNGTTWTNQYVLSNASAFSPINNNTFAYLNGVYVTYMRTSSQVFILRSVDGSAWTEVYSFSCSVEPKITAGNGLFFLISSTNGLSFLVSSDGFSWQSAGVFAGVVTLQNPMALLCNTTSPYNSSKGFTWTGSLLGSHKLWLQSDSYVYNKNTSFAVPTQGDPLPLATAGAYNNLYIKAL